MPTRLATLDLSLAIVGTQYSIPFADFVPTPTLAQQMQPTLEGPITLAMYNESGVGFTATWPLSAKTFTIAAGQWPTLYPPANENQLNLTVLYILPNAPVNIASVDLFLPGEKVYGTGALGNSPINGGTTPFDFNVLSYGAKLDGITDDTLAVQKALNAAANTGFGGAVLIPYGIAYINTFTPHVYGSTSVPCGLSIPSNVALYSNSRGGATLKMGTSGGNQAYLALNQHSFGGGGDTDITILNLTLDGNAINNALGTTDAQYGIQMYATQRGLYSNIETKNFYGTTAGGNGPNGTNGESGCLAFLFSLDCKMVNVHCHTTSGQTGSGIAVNNCTNPELVNVTIENMTLGQGLAVFQCQNVMCTNVNAYLNGHSGLNFEQTDTISLSNCIAGGVYQATVGAATFYTAGQSLGNTTTGLNFSNCQHITVSGCLASNNGGHGIAHYSAGGKSLLVVGGTFNNNTLFGIFLDANTFRQCNIIGRPELFTNGSGAIATGGTPATCIMTGKQTAPAIAASTVAVNNPFPYGVMIFVTAAGGGAVTNVALDGALLTVTIAAGASQWFRVEQAGNIALTYAVAPTWQWFAAP